MVENPLASIFGFVGSFYGLIVPLLTVFFLAILFLASLTATGAKPKSVGEAVYVYVMHGVSVLLMTIGALPTVYSVFASISFGGRMYIALLMLFAIGGLLFLVQDQATRTLDSAAKAVMEAIYFTTLKLIGNLFTLFAALSFFLNIVLNTEELNWWVMPLVLLLYGLLLSWCTKGSHDWAFVQSMQAPAAPATKRASASRAKTKKRAPVKRKTKK